jgi:hypothetical protein
MWGALSDERTGLSFARVTVSSNKSVVSMYNICIYNIYNAYSCSSCLSYNPSERTSVSNSTPVCLRPLPTNGSLTAATMKALRSGM